MNFQKLKVAMVLSAGLFMTLPVVAQTKEQSKIKDATTVLADFSNMKETIPSELLQVTQGIIIVPKMINAGFVVGGKRGKGIAMVKKSDAAGAIRYLLLLQAVVLVRRSESSLLI